jgi:hypothetical protein
MRGLTSNLVVSIYLEGVVNRPDHRAKSPGFEMIADQAVRATSQRPPMDEKKQFVEPEIRQIQ